MSRSNLALVSLLTLIVGVFANDASARGPARSHIVQAGQTLWEIASVYGCGVDDIQGANKIDDNHILPGQKLAIPRCKGARSGSVPQLYILTHLVSEGDTLYEIAKHYDTSVEDLRSRNQLSGNIIKPGQELRIAVGKDGQGRPIPGQSIGSAANGRLEHGMQLPRGKGYYRRRPHRAWGANHTIYHIRRAISTVRSRHPKLHDVAIGDLSRRKGGPLGGHRSHQSGRDVDIGLYFKKVPKGYPRNFIRGTKRNVDISATWHLIEAFADTADTSSGVAMMFLDYDLQKLLYEEAKANGVSKPRLRKLFQYPRGKSSPTGIIRHEPGHGGHVHVRFKCPPSDNNCH